MPGITDELQAEVALPVGVLPARAVTLSAVILFPLSGGALPALPLALQPTKKGSRHHSEDSWRAPLPFNHTNTPNITGMYAITKPVMKYDIVRIRLRARRGHKSPGQTPGEFNRQRQPMPGRPTGIRP